MILDSASTSPNSPKTVFKTKPGTGIKPVNGPNLPQMTLARVEAHSFCLTGFGDATFTGPDNFSLIIEW